MNRKQKLNSFVDDEYTINVTGRNVMVTNAMKEYALDKLSKIERFSNRIIEINLTMDIQRAVHRVDIVMKVDHVVVKSSASSEDMYASIDKAATKLQRQVIKFHKRIHEHTGKKLSTVDLNVNIVPLCRIRNWRRLTTNRVRNQTPPYRQLPSARNCIKTNSAAENVE